MAHYLHYLKADWDRQYEGDLILASYQFGENLLHNLTDAMGQPAMSAALRELHIPAGAYFRTSVPSGPREIPDRIEEEIYDTFLDHTPLDRVEEVLRVYQRLHGGAFAFADRVLGDDHGDYPLSATELQVGQAAEGSLDYPVDLDFFRFKPEKDRKYTVKVDHERLGISGISLYIYHYDSSSVRRPGNLIPKLWTWKSRQQTPSGPEIRWMAPSSFQRYFVVENFGAKTGPYTLTLTEVEDVEDDHGDSLDTATGISTGETVAGTVDNDFDFDYFRFEAIEDRRYEIEVVPGTLQSFRTRLFTARNASPWNWNNLYPDDEAHGPGSYRVTWRAPDSGVYYLAVDGYNENLGTYTVRVTDLGDDS